MSGVWFRKSLRLHDNAPLSRAATQGGPVVPFYILDPSFDQGKASVNRYNFLLESLRDLDAQLREHHRSRLLVLSGKPDEVLSSVLDGKTGFPAELKTLFWEKDTEPYARARDAQVMALAKEKGVKVEVLDGHTLLDVDVVIATKGFKAPISMSSVQKLVQAHGPIAKPLRVPNLPPLEVEGFEVPGLTDIYVEENSTSAKYFPGGEREALRRLDEICADATYVCNFEKPKTASTGRPGSPWEPSTTGLSPYLTFGCLSVRRAWHDFDACCHGRSHTQPPQSLHGQLLFREMFYILSVAVPNWDKAEGNHMSKNIAWGEDATLLQSWSEGRTGYPFIDALMRQLREIGWMHHLGRHAVACFLTRGDLWQSWTKGRDVFDYLLIDSDWALNNGNWLWLAGVAPFSSPYFRIYDPCPGPKSSLNAEQTGEFVKRFVPELRAFPSKYIYKPWTAPLEVQERAGCIIGKDYPEPIVDHAKARVSNLAKFKANLEVLKNKSETQPSAKFKGGLNAMESKRASPSSRKGISKVASAGAKAKPKRAWKASSSAKKAGQANVQVQGIDVTPDMTALNPMGYFEQSNSHAWHVLDAVGIHTAAVLGVLTGMVFSFALLLSRQRASSLGSFSKPRRIRLFIA